MKRVLSLVVLIALACLSLAGPIKSISQSDPLRKKLLDMIRPKMEKNVHTAVKFKIEKFLTQDGYAFVKFMPIKASGGDIDWKHSQYKEAYNAGAFDPGGAALYKNKVGRWQLLTWSFGNTDVFWEPWPEQFGCSHQLLGLP